MELEKFIRQCNCLAFDLLLWCAAASTPCRQHFACKAKCNINKPGPKTKRNMSTCHTKHKLPLGPGQPPDIERRTWYTGTQNFSWYTRNTPRNFKLNYVRSPVPKAGTDKTFENAQMWVYVGILNHPIRRMWPTPYGREVCGMEWWCNGGGLTKLLGIFIACSLAIK